MSSDDLLAKSERAIRSARLLLEDSDPDASASRLYYAMFYVAEALLDALGLSFSSHHAVHAAYGKHFALTGVLDPRFHRALLNAFHQRQLGDYATEAHVAAEVLEALLVDAEDFLTAARAWLRTHEP
jgi:uncharacterized protein (UPF0332 family)